LENGIGWFLVEPGAIDDLRSVKDTGAFTLVTATAMLEVVVDPKDESAPSPESKARCLESALSTAFEAAELLASEATV
jgi:hypothetical protein